MRNKKTFVYRATGFTMVLLSLTGCGGGSNGGGGFIPVSVAQPAGAAPPAPAPSVMAQQACETLRGKTVGGATVVSASVVPASSEVPVYCKVSARIDSKLNFELSLPDAWNNKPQYVGGGGCNGSVVPLVTGDLSSLLAIKGGYAVVASDSGHQAFVLDASWALNDPTAAPGDLVGVEGFGYLIRPKHRQGEQIIGWCGGERLVLFGRQRRQAVPGQSRR